MDKYLKAAQNIYEECQSVIGQAAIGIVRRNEYCHLDEENELVNFDGANEELRVFVNDFSDIIGEVAERICKEEINKIDELTYEDCIDNK